MSELRFALCDFNGVQIDQDGLAGRLPGAEVNVGVNQIRDATLTLPLEDPASALVSAFDTKLKVWLRDELILFGPVTLPRYAEGAVTITARGAEALLEQSFTRLELAPDNDPPFPDPELAALAIYLATVQADHQRQTAAVPSHGIIEGTVESTGQEWTDADGAILGVGAGENIWKFIEIILGKAGGGMDIEFRPLDREDGVFAEVNTHVPQQGTDRSADVIFEYGIGRHNAAAFAWEPGGGVITNRYVVNRGSGKTPYVAYNVASQEQFGLYEGFEVRDAEYPSAQAQRLAKRVVAERAFPQDFFTATPTVEQGDLVFAYMRDPVTDVLIGEPGEGLGSPPLFGPDGDYWIGDGIRTIARELPGLDVDLRGRVMSSRLIEVESGAVVAEHTIAPEVDDSDVVVVAGTLADRTLGFDIGARGDGGFEPLYMPFPTLWRGH